MILQACPFNDENLIVNISSDENEGKIDELLIVDTNRTFQNGFKSSKYVERPNTNKNVRHEFADVSKDFVQNDMIGKIKLAKYRFKRDGYSTILSLPTWYNEGFQRNLVASYIHPDDDDIVILSDVDEIIDSRKIDELIEETHNRGIVTGKLHFTVFYFNLFSQNWGGAPDYSYRLFSMTGKYYKKMKMSSDELRKRGEHGELLGKIHCIESFIGFHHSWLGDEKLIGNKLKSYAHIDEHRGMNSREYIQKCLSEHKSLFPGQELKVDYSIPLLQSVEKLRNDPQTQRFFL